jgi:hypothetical protein
MSLFQQLFGGDATGISQLLSPEQQAAINRQSMMALGARLLQNSRTPQRMNLAQGVGQALEAGMQAQQTGQTNAVQQMLLGQKLREAQLANERTQQFSELFGGGAAGAPPSAAPLTPEQALLASPDIGGRVGPTAQRADMIGTTPEPMPSGMPAPTAAGAAPMTLQAFVGSLPLAERQALAVMEPSEAMKVVNERFAAARKFGAPQNLVIDGKPKAVQFNELGEMREVKGAAPFEATPTSIREYQFALSQGYKGTFEQFDQQQRGASASRQTVITGGQKGFDNERSLRNDFRSEPIVKAYEDMAGSYQQVVSALNQNSPIGDVAGATKIMKLLDPGSVVRESELGLAMESGGRMDRLQNYFNMWKTGKKLTPTQRVEFQNLATELMAAAAQAYNAKRESYVGIANDYGFNVGRTVGEPAKVPSIMPRNPPRQPGAPASGPRNVGDYFQ